MAQISVEIIRLTGSLLRGNLQRSDIEHADALIQKRLNILVMIDVATRMPLSWIIAENPCAEATLALFRMATRDKTREKLLYGCSGEPAAAVGLLHVKNDNGTGLRNNACISALLGIGSINSIGRTYASTDRPYIERLFGTLESVVLKPLPGYTGRRPGDLPGYDAMQNGVLNVDLLYGILTRYFIDEYPSTRHMGIGMGARRPFDVYKEVNDTRGQVLPIDPNLRRIHLGWEICVKPTDEGVLVFSGIWFNSNELQEAIDLHHISEKVKVYVDPENLDAATVILPNVKEPVEVRLQFSAFSDLTLPQVLKLMNEHRASDAKLSEHHNDQVMRTRISRANQIKAIGVEHKLPRSYSTIGECQNMAKAVFSGARVINSSLTMITTAPGAITDIGAMGQSFNLGSSDWTVEGQIEEVQPQETSKDLRGFVDDVRTIPTNSERNTRKASGVPSGLKQKTATVALARPETLKELE
jgi:putative transposase